MVFDWNIGVFQHSTYVERRGPIVYMLSWEGTEKPTKTIEGVFHGDLFFNTSLFPFSFALLLP